MNANIKLNRKQILQLFDLYNRFDDIEWFEIEQSHESGIGPTVRIKFDLFNRDHKPDTTIDITDVTTW
jgi:hypothetical protein